MNSIKHYFVTSFVSALALTWTTVAHAVCDECVEVNQVNVSLAVGYGYYPSAFVSGEEKAPLSVLADISWYGESLYLDNTEFGKTFWLNNWELDTFIRLNPENWLLTSTKSLTLLPINTLGAANDTPGLSNDQVPETAVDKPQGSNIDSSNSTTVVTANQGSDKNPLASSYDLKRDWAIDAGFRLRHAAEHYNLDIALFRDISQTYNGYQFSTSVSRQLSLSSWNIGGRLGVSYKSRNLINYYYGLRDTERQQAGLPLLESGWFPFISVTAVKPINRSWHWLFKARYQQLDKTTTKSPLIADDHALRVFAGVSYVF